MPRASLPALRLVLAVALALAAALVGPEAEAQELTPELAAAGRRREAELEARALAQVLPTADRRALRGVYVAFDPTPSDPYAISGCDDDGDYVVVVSDALLSVLEHFARAAAVDDGGALVRAYAERLASAKVQNARIMPPPPGFFDAAPAKDPKLLAARQLEIFREALAHVVARELVHMAVGDLRCPNPTITKEAGDDVWTPAERARALAGAMRVYAGRDHAIRGRAAIALAGATGRGAGGANAFLAFMAAIEARAPGFGWAFHHPQRR